MQSIISRYPTLPIVLLLFSLALTSCLDSSDSNQTQGDLLETAKSVTDGNGDDVLSTFVGLLGEAGTEDTPLDSTVANEGPFTLFIPVDSAFSALPENKLDDLSRPELTSVLEYHMVDGIVNINQLNAEEDIESIEGEDLLFEITSNSTGTSNSYFVNDGRLITSFSASNGAIYVIDKVLFPDMYLNVADLIAKRYQLNELEEAIDDADLTSTLEDTTSAYTVFAPSDEAIDDADLSASDIEYHILEQKLLYEDLNSQTYTTMSGQELTVEVSGGTITINGEATVTTDDIEGINGVVHIIDAVLEVSSE